MQGLPHPPGIVYPALDAATVMAHAKQASALAHRAAGAEESSAGERPLCDSLLIAPLGPGPATAGEVALLLRRWPAPAPHACPLACISPGPASSPAGVPPSPVAPRPLGALPAALPRRRCPVA